ncbi:MAG: 50S ribosomal protein L7ae [Lachnospiraceae bacterium]|nr:50S ribosomal protein L7ae [Lachnospiraceae bacterium]
MNTDRVLSLLGLAKKAGKVVSGEFSVEEAVKKGTAKLVLTAEDASGNTKKLFTNKCAFYKVPYMTCGTKETLGRAIGNQFRASVAVTDEGFRDAIVKLLNQGGSLHGQKENL